MSRTSEVWTVDDLRVASNSSLSSHPFARQYFSASSMVTVLRTNGRASLWINRIRASMAGAISANGGCSPRI